MNSPLAKFVGKPFDAPKLKKEAWRDLNILIISADDNRLDWVEKEFISRIGKRIYGKAKGR